MTKVMIVDDDRTMVKLMRTLLELDGFEVVQVSRSSDVLPTLRNEQPDVTLMDVNLADADGLEFLKEIRAEPQLANQKIIMSSGLDLADECEVVGADAFIQKPYPPDKLADIIRQLANDKELSS